MTLLPSFVTAENGRLGARKPSCARGDTPSERLSVTIAHLRRTSPSTSQRRKSGCLDTDSRSDWTRAGSAFGAGPDGAPCSGAGAVAPAGKGTAGAADRCRSQKKSPAAPARTTTASAIHGARLGRRSSVLGISMALSSRDLHSNCPGVEDPLAVHVRGGGASARGASMERQRVSAGTPWGDVVGYSR